MQQAEKARGIAPNKLLNPPSILPEFIHIWGWFEDLIDCRDSSFGVSVIKHSEIYSYFNLMWIAPNPQEVLVLRLIDKIFVEIMSDDEK